MEKLKEESIYGEATLEQTKGIKVDEDIEVLPLHFSSKKNN